VGLLELSLEQNAGYTECATGAESVLSVKKSGCVFSIPPLLVMPRVDAGSPPLFAWKLRARSSSHLNF